MKSFWCVIKHTETHSFSVDAENLKEVILKIENGDFSIDKRKDDVDEIISIEEEVKQQNDY